MSPELREAVYEQLRRLQEALLGDAEAALAAELEQFLDKRVALVEERRTERRELAERVAETAPDEVTRVAVAPLQALQEVPQQVVERPPTQELDAPDAEVEPTRLGLHHLAHPGPLPVVPLALQLVVEPAARDLLEVRVQTTGGNLYFYSDTRYEYQNKMAGKVLGIYT